MYTRSIIPSLSESIFLLLSQLIQDRTGISYQPNSRDLLAEKLAPRIIEHGFTSFLDYYYLLKYDAAAEAEWQFVIEILSVQETFFWREFDKIQALTTDILPQYVERFPGCPIRIWSAACSTGEEPLTIAMALNEAGWFDRLPIKIYASDISPKAIATAQAGIYRERSFRAIPDPIKLKYFQPIEQVWQIDRSLHHRIQWSLTNLMNLSEMDTKASATVIFCRNVFIYFSDEMIRKVVQYFYTQMPSPGYLFLGASESLLKLNTDFELREIGGAFVYVKS